MSLPPLLPSAGLFPAESLSSFCPCPGTFKETEFKGGRLVNLAEEVTKHPNIHSVAWVLLEDFSQIYAKIQEQKQMWKVFSFITKEVLAKLG